MIDRTAARRTTVLGLGALGVLAVAAPASALDAGAALGRVTAAVGVVDPLVAPLQQGAGPQEGSGPAAAVQPVTAVVQQTVATAEATLASVTGGGAGPTEPTGGTDPEPPAAPAPRDVPRAVTPQQPAAGPGTAAPATTGTTPPAAAGGSAPVSFPGSIAAFDHAAGFGVGTGTAANPVSLFGAPQVASVPTLQPGVAAPQVLAPAGDQLSGFLPAGGPQTVPGHLATLACAVVAAAAAAHVAALRGRHARACVPA